MTSALVLVAVLIGSPLPARAQASDTITVALDVRTEGRQNRDETAARVEADVKLALQAIGDVAIVPRPTGRHTIWIVTGAGPSASNSASVVVTERYDRKTLLTLGIKDDRMADEMMQQRMVVNHELFTGRDLQGLATRIVEWLDGEIFAKIRAEKHYGAPLDAQVSRAGRR